MPLPIALAPAFCRTTGQLLISVALATCVPGLAVAQRQRVVAVPGAECPKPAPIAAATVQPKSGSEPNALPVMERKSAEKLAKGLKGQPTSKTLLSFLVDIDGMVDPCEITVLLESDTAVTALIVSKLPTLRYTPGRMGGTPVKIKVQQTFTTD